MASISYLWTHRARFKFLSAACCKAWAKRILTLGTLWCRHRKRSRLIKRGGLIAPTAEIGNANINGKASFLSIGENSFIGSDVELALHAPIRIGNNVCINDGVKILTASHDVMQPEWPHIKKEIVIGDYAWIATNAILLPGVIIGKGAVIGAGAVVARNVEDFQIVVGNPAHALSKKRISNLTYNPCAFLAENQAWLKG